MSKLESPAEKKTEHEITIEVEKVVLPQVVSIKKASELMGLPAYYASIVKRIGDKAGIRHLHPHMFRHTFVSILMSNPDIGVATVAAEAGHAQPSTTLMIYTQQYKKRQESIRNQLSRELYGT